MTQPTVSVHEEWSTPGFELDALAANTGPFVRRDILRVWHRRRGLDGKVLLVEGHGALLPWFEREGVLGFLGEADLIDYHSPLGESAAAITDLTAAFMTDVAPGTVIHLDSLPAEAADALEHGLIRAGVTVAREQHEVAAVLELPSGFEDWLMAIGKKERHEVRRKRRRFEAELGSPHLVRCPGTEGVAVFAAMHRFASGDKGSFMTEDMEALFLDLYTDAGAVVDVLYSHDGDPVAAAFGFEDADAYYLYNSAYDPAARDASPGIVMLASLIQRAIDAERSIFDFLKGDETYKFRHGAVARPLFRLTGMVGA